MCPIRLEKQVATDGWGVFLGELQQAMWLIKWRLPMFTRLLGTNGSSRESEREREREKESERQSESESISERERDRERKREREREREGGREGGREGFPCDVLHPELLPKALADERVSVHSFGTHAPGNPLNTLWWLDPDSRFLWINKEIRFTQCVEKPPRGFWSQVVRSLREGRSFMATSSLRHRASLQESRESVS